jgi:hypothetical protein
MNISLAPITSKGMMNAMEHHSNNRLYMAQIPLSHYLPISRQISFVKFSERRVSIAHLR